MHCLGFNDITNFENGPSQRCDDDPDVNGDGHGDFHYMPEPSIMSYCNNPWVLTDADVRGLRNAGYAERHHTTRSSTTVAATGRLLGDAHAVNVGAVAGSS